MKKTAPAVCLILALMPFAMLIGCTNPSVNNNSNQNNAVSAISLTATPDSLASETMKTDTIYKVTFIELGSVRCIPCQKMQTVMKSVEEKYGDQVKVVFHDVWTKEGEPFGEKFGIHAIPTQVFLDENGKEFYRHEGYFPEEDLIKVLKTKGVK